MKLSVVALVAFVATIPAVMGGCAKQSSAKVGKPVQLLFFCAAGLRPAMEEIVDSFETHHPGITVATTYDGSGKLLTQVAAMPRGDVFAPGEQYYIDIARERRLLAPDSAAVIAWYIPVILVRKDNPLKIATLSDLARLKLKLAVGDERACAVGRTTVDLIRHNGIDSAGIAANVVYKSGTVLELASAVQMGTVDAAVVWDCTARQFVSGADMVPIDPAANIITPVPVSILKSSVAMEESRAFVRFLAGPLASGIFVSHGYTVTLDPKPTKG